MGKLLCPKIENEFDEHKVIIYIKYQILWIDKANLHYFGIQIPLKPGHVSATTTKVHITSTPEN